jgi:hypothetical protein
MPHTNDPTSHGAKSPYDVVLAAICQGTHVCAFYETEDDLIDLVGQFCAAGVRRGDLCLWVMPDDMNAEPLAGAGIEVYSATDMYLRGGAFEAGPMIALWEEKLADALAHNHAGLSASGHTCWLQQRDWQAFMEYERYLNQVIAGKPISLLCTYPLSACKAGDVFEVVRAHQVALAKQQDHWSVIESHLTDDRPAALDAASRVTSLSDDKGHRLRTRPQRPDDRSPPRARHQADGRTHDGRGDKAADACFAIGPADGRPAQCARRHPALRRLITAKDRGRARRRNGLGLQVPPGRLPNNRNPAQRIRFLHPNRRDLYKGFHEVLHHIVGWNRQKLT